jgi:hypothetical protein
MNGTSRIEIEEVDEAPKPPKARVSETFERKRDYLTGFLAEKPAEPRRWSRAATSTSR